jgi:hypothetical protein
MRHPEDDEPARFGEYALPGALFVLQLLGIAVAIYQFLRWFAA